MTRLIFLKDFAALEQQFVWCFSIIKTDCFSRIELTLIKEINQLAINKQYGLYRTGEAFCCLDYYALFSLH